MAHDASPCCQIFCGTAQWLTPLEQLEKNFTHECDIFLDIADAPADATEAQIRNLERNIVAAYRVQVGFQVDTRDVQFTCIPHKKGQYQGMGGRYGYYARWTIARVRLELVREGPNGLGGGVSWMCRSLPVLATPYVLNHPEEFPTLVVLAAQLLTQTDWLLGFVRRGVGADPTSDSGVQNNVRNKDLEGWAKLFRYWDTLWGGVGCTNRALYAAATRMVMGAGTTSSRQDDATKDALSKSRSRKPGPDDALFSQLADVDLMAKYGLNPFRHHPARTAYENGSFNPLCAWAVENKKVVQYDPMRPQFFMDPAGISRAVKRIATITALHFDRANADAQFAGEGTIYGAGWNGSDLGHEAGYEMMIALERSHANGWNEEYGATFGLSVRFDVRDPHESSLGWGLVASSHADVVVCTQRIPAWAWGVYTMDPYLEPSASPTLGKAILVKSGNTNDATRIGQHFDITEMPESGKTVFVTEKGSAEDEVSTPYKLGLMINGRYHALEHTCSAAAIDASLPNARSHNRGVSTAPWQLFGLGETVQFQLVVKARSPPQPGGLACIGHNCIPQWAMDASSHTRVVVTPDHVELSSSVTRFRG
jgi:hypothetical protein